MKKPKTDVKRCNFKLHKRGKQWVTIAASLLMLSDIVLPVSPILGVGIHHVFADTTQQVTLEFDMPDANHQYYVYYWAEGVQADFHALSIGDIASLTIDLPASTQGMGFILLKDKSWGDNDSNKLSGDLTASGLEHGATVKIDASLNVETINAQAELTSPEAPTRKQATLVLDNMQPGQDYYAWVWNTAPGQSDGSFMPFVDGRLRLDIHPDTTEFNYIITSTNDWNTATKFTGDETMAIIEATAEKTVILPEPAVIVDEADWNEFDRTYGYSGQLGATYDAAGSEFKVWAPTANKVELLVYPQATNSIADQTAPVSQVIDMTRGTQASPDNHATNDIGVWSTTQAVPVNTIYTYRLTFGDGQVLETQDPYSIATVADGERSVLVDSASLAPSGFSVKQGADATWRVADPTDAVVSEVHVRDFSLSASSGVSESNRGNFLGMIESGTQNASGTSTGIDHLKDLGVNYVQIMPAYDFASVPENGNPNDPDLNQDQFNWGYDPENYNVPEGSYSSNPNDPINRIHEMKTMIQGFHNQGMGVIMDVVYNHVYDQMNSPFEQTLPGYFFQQGNGAKATGCGNTTATQREMMEKYIIESTVYWAKEYNVDGFRFDLMGLLSTELLQKIRVELDKIDPNIIMYGEGWQMSGALPGQALGYGDQWQAQNLNGVGFFNDKMRDATKGAEVYGAISKGFVNQTPNQNNVNEKDLEGTLAKAILGSSELLPFINPSQNVNYIEAHDNYNLNDLTWINNPNDDQETHNKRLELANTINLLSQGVGFIEVGQDFGRTKLVDTDGDGSFSATEHEHSMNSYNAGDAVNQVDWNTLTQNYDSHGFISQVINFRKANPSFSLDNYSDIYKNVTITSATDNSGVVTYTVQQGDQKFLVVFNASGQTLSIGGSEGLVANTDLDLTTASIVLTNDDALQEKVGQAIGQKYLNVSNLTATVIDLTADAKPIVPENTAPFFMVGGEVKEADHITYPAFSISGSDMVSLIYGAANGMNLSLFPAIADHMFTVSDAEEGQAVISDSRDKDFSFTLQDATGKVFGPSERIKVLGKNVSPLQTPGTYTITYTVTDDAGASSTFTRTITVTPQKSLTQATLAFVDTFGNAIQTPIVSELTQAVGSNYALDYPETITAEDGSVYELVSTEATEGKIPEGDVVIQDTNQDGILNEEDLVLDGREQDVIYVNQAEIFATATYQLQVVVPEEPVIPVEPEAPQVPDTPEVPTEPSEPTEPIEPVKPEDSKPSEEAKTKPSKEQAKAEKETAKSSAKAEKEKAKQESKAKKSETKANAKAKKHVKTQVVLPATTSFTSTVPPLTTATTEVVAPRQLRAPRVQTQLLSTTVQRPTRTQSELETQEVPILPVTTDAMPSEVVEPEPEAEVEPTVVEAISTTAVPAEEPTPTETPDDSQTEVSAIKLPDTIDRAKKASQLSPFWLALPASGVTTCLYLLFGKRKF